MPNITFVRCLFSSSHLIFVSLFTDDIKEDSQSQPFSWKLNEFDEGLSFFILLFCIDLVIPMYFFFYPLKSLVFTQNKGTLREPDQNQGELCIKLSLFETLEWSKTL